MESFIDIISGIPIQSEDILEEELGIRILRGINITEGVIRHNKEIDRYYAKPITDKIQKFVLEEKDLVLGMDGSKVGKNVALISKPDVGSILIQRVARIKALKNADIDFIFQKIYSNKFQRYVDVVNTSSGIPHISLQQIKDFETCFPVTLSEQTKIASFLSLIDKRIATQNKIIEDLRLLKSTISNLLLRNPNWKKYKIKDIGELGRGRVISTTEIKSQQTPKYPVYSSQTSNNGIMGYLDTYAFEGEYLTWTTDGANAGTVFYRKGKFNCTNVCGTIKVNDQHNPYFVSQCLQLVTRKYVSTDLANPKLMNNTMASIEITLPDKETQEFISDLLWCIDEKYSLENELFSRHMDVKKYLLSNLFV